METPRKGKRQKAKGKRQKAKGGKGEVGRAHEAPLRRQPDPHVLPFAYCLLPFTFCLLPFAFYLLPFTFCLLPCSSLRLFQEGAMP
jgi:hypothetical protein